MISNIAERKSSSESDEGRPEIQIQLQDIGLGTLRTSATYAAALIQLEGRRCEQIDVLDSVMEALGISPEEIIHNRKMPDCSEEELYDAWNERAKELARESAAKHS